MVMMMVVVVKTKALIWFGARRAGVHSRVAIWFHDLDERSLASGTRLFVRVRILIPLMPTIVTEHYVAPLDWLEVLTSRCHWALPGLLISSEGGDAEAES